MTLRSQSVRAACREIARTILSELEHEVLLAENGEEGVSLWRAEQPDLILMDVQMPGMDGFAATAAIREAEPEGERVPIVAMTGHDSEADEARCREAGMTGFLAKPAALKDIRTEIERVLGRT